MKKVIPFFTIPLLFLLCQPFQALPGQNPSAESSYRTGMRYIQKKKLDRAVDSLKKAVAGKPEVARYHIGLGEAFRIKGCCDEAVSSYQKALALEPENGEALCRLGDVHAALGQNDEAILCYEKFIETSRNKPEALSVRGKIFDLKGEREKAIAAYRESLSLRSGNFDTLVALASDLVRAERFPEATDLFLRAKKIRPYDETSW